MNVDEVIDEIKRDHRTCAWPGETIEPRPLVTRHAVPSVDVRFVTAHALDQHNADAAIQEELAHASETGTRFEWKLFSFDRPDDLRQRLKHHGFTIGEREAIMVYDLEDGLQPFNDSPYAVRRIEREEDLRDFRLVAEEAFGKDYSPTTNALADAIRKGEKGHAAYVAYLGGEPASVGRLYTTPASRIAGLYGGGTRPQFRGRGLYRAVVAARAHAAQESGARYLLVDAMPTSFPILQRLGFTHVADTWPCGSPTA
jgi:predicted N-acetyltransferase YhbS